MREQRVEDEQRDQPDDQQDRADDEDVAPAAPQPRQAERDQHAGRRARRAAAPQPSAGWVGAGPSRRSEPGERPAAMDDRKPFQMRARPAQQRRPRSAGAAGRRRPSEAPDRQQPGQQRAATARLAGEHRWRCNAVIEAIPRHDEQSCPPGCQPDSEERGNPAIAIATLVPVAAWRTDPSSEAVTTGIQSRGWRSRALP